MAKIPLSDKEAMAHAASNAWYSTGYAPTKEMRSRAAGGGSFTLNFWLKEDETCLIRFLTDEPINIMEHNIRMLNRFESRTCLEGTGEVCPLCEAGHKRRVVGIYAVIDRREHVWKDKKTQQDKKEKDQIKIWRCGQRSVSTLERFLAKYGTLKGRNFEVTRIGAGTDTVYNFVPEAPQALPMDKAKVPNIIDLVKPKSRAIILRELGQILTKEEDEVIVTEQTYNK